MPSGLGIDQVGDSTKPIAKSVIEYSMHSVLH